MAIVAEPLCVRPFLRMKLTQRNIEFIIESSKKPFFLGSRSHSRYRSRTKEGRNNFIRNEQREESGKELKGDQI